MNFNPQKFIDAFEVYHYGKNLGITMYLDLQTFKKTLAYLDDDDSAGYNMWCSLINYPRLHKFFFANKIDYSSVIRWGLSAEPGTPDVRVELLEGLTYQVSEHKMIHLHLGDILSSNECEEDPQVRKAFINYIDAISKRLAFIRKFADD